MKTTTIRMDSLHRTLFRVWPLLWLGGTDLSHAATNPPPTASSQCPLPSHVAVGLMITIAALLIGICVSFSRGQKPYTHPEEEC